MMAMTLKTMSGMGDSYMGEVKRKGRISRSRTGDPLFPKQVRYLLRHNPSTPARSQCGKREGRSADRESVKCPRGTPPDCPTSLACPLTDGGHVCHLPAQGIPCAHCLTVAAPGRVELPISTVLSWCPTFGPRNALCGYGNCLPCRRATLDLNRVRQARRCTIWSLGV